MFKSYWTSAWRNLVRQKGYAVLNISGLAVGIASAVLILLYVTDELSYDRFHPNADRLYRVTMTTTLNDQENANSSVYYPIAPLLMQYEEVAQTARLVSFRGTGQIPSLRYGDKNLYEEGFYFADSNIFSILAVPLKKGDASKALMEPNSVVLTQEMADKYFGDEDPMGRVLRLNGLKDLQVTGVLDAFPGPTHLKMDLIASLSGIANVGFSPAGYDFNNWIANYYWTFVSFKNNDGAAALENSFSEFGRRYLPELHKTNKTQFHLQKVTDIHLRSHFDGDITSNGDITYVYIFSSVGILILLIACVNFMNLATARSARRAREIGLRKVAGAIRSQLIAQFLGESFLLCGIAAVSALFLVEIMLPSFNALTGKSMSVNFVKEPWLGVALAALVVAVGLLAGSYPAFYFSKFQPSRVLKGTFAQSGDGDLLRKALVILQFVISVGLITCTLLAWQQLEFFRSQNIGFNKEWLITIPIRGSAIARSFPNFRTELKKNARITDVTAVSDLIGKGVSFTGFYVEGSQEMKFFSQTRVSHDFIKTYGMRLTEGRDFEEGSSDDSAAAYLVNKAFLHNMGWTSIAGHTLRFWRNPKPGHIIGIIEDFHFQSLQETLKPIVIFIGALNHAVVRVRSEDVAATLRAIETTWNALEHERPFSYSFLDVAIQTQYEAETKLGKLIAYFSGLAIFIACLGLFGLASFTAEQKHREIGIRKTLGASTSNIVFLMIRDFLKFVVAANVIAWPLAYFAMRTWLEDFANHIEIGPTAFVAAAILSAAIAMTTISYQAIKAAWINPLEAMRHES